MLVAPGLHDTSYVVRLAIAALGDDPRVEMVLKPHPRVSAAMVDKWAGDRDENGNIRRARVTVVREGNIYEWMAKCDVFVSTYSSTAVEALAFGIPVVLLIPNDSPDMSMYHGLGVPVLKASSVNEVRQHVAALTSSGEASGDYIQWLTPTLANCFGPTDAATARRLADRCAEVALGTRSYSQTAGAAD